MKTKAIALILVILMMLCMVPTAVAETAVAEAAVESTQDEANGDIATSEVVPGSVAPPVRAIAEPEVFTNSAITSAKPDVPLVSTGNVSNDVKAKLNDLRNNNANSASVNTFSAAAGEAFIVPNMPYTGTLRNASDYMFYIASIPAACDITPFLEFSDNSMNYLLGVLVEDAYGNITAEEYSTFAGNVFGGQFMRLQANAGDTVYMLVESMDGIVDPAKTFTVGVNATNIAQRDAYEINDRFTDNLYVSAFGGSALNGNFDNSYDSDWFILNYTAVAKKVPAIQITSSQNVAFDVYMAVGGYLQFVNTYFSSNGKTILPTPIGNATYYVMLYSSTNSNGSYSLNTYVDREPITFITITDINSIGSEGLDTFGHGTKQDARYWTQGTFRALDQNDDPAAGVTVRVSFNAINGGEQGYQNVVTDANGYGSFHIDVFATYYAYTYTYRSPAGRWRAYYDNAEVWYDPIDSNGNIIESNYAFEPYYYWYAEIYLGS